MWIFNGIFCAHKKAEMVWWDKIVGVRYLSFQYLPIRFSTSPTPPTPTRRKNGWHKSNFGLQKSFKNANSRKLLYELWVLQLIAEGKKNKRVDFCLLKKVIFALVTSCWWWEQTFWKPFCLLFLTSKILILFPCLRRTQFYLYLCLWRQPF